MRYRAVTVIVLLLCATAAVASDVVIEDWAQAPLGHKGIPPAWKGQQWGSPAYEFMVVEDGGKRVLHLRSKDEGSTIRPARCS